MQTMARNYPERCQDVGREPDMALLGPIAEPLQRLQEQQGDVTDDEQGGAR
jgi:hypothetical protein